MEHLVGLTYARHPVRVLGVDPGLTRCGVGVVDGAPGRALTLVRVGVIRTSAADDRVRDRPPPLVTPGRAARPEGPFGQVELRVQVVVGTDGTNQDRCRIRSVGHEHPP